MTTMTTTIAANDNMNILGRTSSPILEHARSNNNNNNLTMTNTKSLDWVPTLDSRDIEINRLLGTGAFSAVFSFNLKRKVLLQQQQQEASFRKSNNGKSKQQEQEKKRGLFSRLVRSASTSDLEDSSSRHLQRRNNKDDTTSRTRTKTSLDMTGNELDDHHNYNNHNHNSNNHNPALDIYDNKELLSSIVGNSDQHEWLALKRLSQEAKHCPRQLVVAQRELYKEAKTLASFMAMAQEGPYHPNIVRFYGLSKDFCIDDDSGSHNSNLRQCSESAFIVLERLTESLDQRLHRWKREEKEASRVSVNWKQLFQTKKKSKQNQMTDETTTTTTSGPTALDNNRRITQARRIQQVALGVASALAFLHDEAQMVYRDVKPCNVGFAADGTVRLFDFSTARKMPSKKKLPGFVGTPRYMAPENAMGLEYGYSADVFSFGLLLWELLSLEKPYRQANSAQQVLEMQESHFTHSVDMIASSTVQQLLLSNVSNSDATPTTTNTRKPQEDCRSRRCCWNQDPKSRPTMKQIHEILSQEVTQVLANLDL